MIIMFAWVGRLTEYFTPPLFDPELRSRFRFGIQAWFIAWPMAVLWTFISMAQGLWMQCGLNALMAVAGPISLFGMKATRSLSPWFQITLFCALLLYGPGILGQTPIDETGLFFSVIIPLVAGFMFGGASALRWTVLTAGASIGSLLLAQRGYTLPVGDPTPTLTKSLNIITALTMAALFAARFHEVQRQALANAEGANRAKSLFLASISHEIRTPMNGVLGMTEVMLQEATEPAAREQLAVIHRSGQLLVSLLNDLLDLTKLEAQRLELDRGDFDLEALLGDVAQLFTPMAREKGVTLEVTPEPGLPMLRHGDAMRLRQVLFNLVNNGIKFTERGRVALSVRRGEDDDALVFAVQDTGIGISVELQSRLFTVFEQADASTTRRFGGTGLGLALARQLVVLMGGEIVVESQKGVGSLFQFSVALPRAVAAPERTPTQVAAANNEPKGRVLVVDDNPINLKVATSLVRKAGYEADGVSSGGEAVRCASSQPYLAVLMDCHMPDMDGFEATRRIRALPGPHGAVTIIALTASTSEEDLEACRRSGMNEVLAKPVSLDAIQRALSPVKGRAARG